jgi:hypothetical protein
MAITISGSGITSANIADGTIVNADINSSAAIAASKLTGTGKVLQVVSFTTNSNGNVTVNSSDTTLNPDIYKSITPIKSGSNILITIRWTGELSCSAIVGINVLRDGSRFNVPGTGYHQGMVVAGRMNASNVDTACFSTLDTTGTTASSAITYRLAFSRDSTNTATVYTGLRSGGGEAFSNEITLTEISS